jgi:dolichyl-diphosphooligosaccharide--protein glycosyltransferase
MKNSLMYKMSYYRYVVASSQLDSIALTLAADSPNCSAATQLRTESEGRRSPKHQSSSTHWVSTLTLRCCSIKRTFADLHALDEAFTSENWIVRIYQVKKEDPLGRELKDARAFDSGRRLKKSKSATESSIVGGSRKSRPSM